MATEKAKPLMSKKAAIAAAKAATAKKSTKPAKKKSAAKTPKPKPAPQSKKAAKAPKPLRTSTALVSTIPPADLDTLNRDADANVQRLQEMIPEHVVRGAEIYNVMEDHRRRELWKFGSTPYKSWDAFVTHYAELANISKRTLEAVVSSNKFLPGVSAETKKKAGPRKVKKLVAAVKKHREKTGNPEAELPPEIIDAATTQPEKEFDETLKAADLAPEKPEPLAEPERIPFDAAPADPLLHHEAKEQPFKRGKKGSSGAVEGKNGDAQQFGSVVEQAVDAQQLISGGEISLSKIEALQKIAEQWMKFPCVAEGLEDMTNSQAADHLTRQKGKNGK